MVCKAPVYRELFPNQKNFYAHWLFFYKDSKIEHTLFLVLVNKLGKGFYRLMHILVRIQPIFAANN